MFKLFSTIKKNKGDVSNLERPFIVIDGSAYYFNEVPNEEQMNTLKAYMVEKMPWLDRADKMFDRNAFRNDFGVFCDKFLFFLATLTDADGKHFCTTKQSGAFTSVSLKLPFSGIVDAEVSKFYLGENVKVSTATEPAATSLFDDEEEPADDTTEETEEATTSLFEEDEEPADDAPADDATPADGPEAAEEPDAGVDKIQQELDFLLANPDTNISSRYNKTKETKEGLPALVDIAARLNIETKGLKESEIVPLVRAALGI